MIYNSMSIIGIVTIAKVGPNNKRQIVSRSHNTITSMLATGIAHFLCENFLANPQGMSNYVPRYLGVSDKDPAANESLANKYNATRLEDEYVGQSGDNEDMGENPTPFRFAVDSKIVNLGGADKVYSSITIRAFIPANSLYSGYQIKSLGLYSSPTSETLLSKITLEPTDYVTKEDGTGIDVTWDLVIAPGNDEAGVTVI